MSDAQQAATPESRLAALEDVRRLERLLLSYARALDETDLGRFEQVLAPDVRARHGEVFAPLEGREAFVAEVARHAPRWLSVQHHLSNVDVELVGERATVHAAVRAVHVVELDGEVARVEAAARYEFGARRRAGAGWWFDDVIIHETWADPRIGRVYADG